MLNRLLSNITGAFDGLSPDAQGANLGSIIPALCGHRLLRALKSECVTATSKGGQLHEPVELAELWKMAVSIGKDTASTIERKMADLLTRLTALSAGLETTLSTAVTWRAAHFAACERVLINLWQLAHYIRTLQEGVLSAAAIIETAKERVTDVWRQVTEAPDTLLPPEVYGGFMLRCEELELLAAFLDQTQEMVAEVGAYQMVAEGNRILIDLEGCGVNASTPCESAAPLQQYACRPRPFF